MASLGSLTTLGLNCGCIFFCRSLCFQFNLVHDDGLLTHSQAPVDIFSKEGMLLDLLSSICTEPSSWITLEKRSHDTLCFPRYVGWEYEWVHEDPLVHRVHIFVIKWWETSLAMDWHVLRHSRRKKYSPSSHIKGRRVSTNRQSWCTLGSPGVPVRYILESHRMLKTTSDQ